ncbi:MAG: HD domain-containing protein [Candidatus Magnetoovum sp. WYHC-5]|nr:HD domain-containing protein [Candidatus Magnetoovum sp. WYHC-5]
MKTEVIDSRPKYYTIDLPLQRAGKDVEYNNAGTVLQDAPFELISLVQAKLYKIFNNLELCKDFTSKIIELCTILQMLCHEDEDVALGTIHMSSDVDYSITHPIKTAIVCEILAQQLGWPEDRRLTLLCAAISMNISMLECQNQFYGKNGKLNNSERQFIRRHPEEAVNILRKLGVNDELWLKTVLQHHEALDGSGYPYGITEKDIISLAKVLSLVDVYCARISPRSYRIGLMPNVAMNMLYMDTQRTVDSNIALVLIKHLGIYPAGTYVRLNNNEIGIVVQRGEKVYCPIVYILFKADGRRTVIPLRRDTSSRVYKIKEVLYPKEVIFDVNLYQLWGYGIFKRKKITKRKHIRYQTNIPAKILDARRVITSDANIINMSRAGCLIRMTKAMNKGYELNQDYYITFRFMNKTLENVKFRIRNATEIFEHCLFGAEFISMENEVRLYLRSFITKIKLSAS